MAYVNTSDEDFIYTYVDDQGVESVLIVSPGGAVNPDGDEQLAALVGADPALEAE